jgi:hypothetical protein
MFPTFETRRSRYLATILSVFGLGVLACSLEDLHTSVRDKEKLLGFMNEPVTIVSFSAAPELDTWNGSPGAAYSGERRELLIQRLLSDQASQMRRVLSSQLHLVDSLTPVDSAHRIRPSEKERIAAAIINANARFGIIGYNQYGWEWSPARSGIATYRFKSGATIHDEQGDLVWKAVFSFVAEPSIGESLRQKLSRMGSVEEFASGVAGQAPSAETIASYHQRAFEHYPRYLLLLIQDDLVGRRHRPGYEVFKTPGFLAYNLSEGEWSLE